VRKKGGGGVRGTLFSGLWILFAIGLVLAGFKVAGVNSMEDGFYFIKNKALYYAECIPANTCGLMSIIEEIKEPGGSLIVDLPPIEDVVNKDGGLNLDALIDRDTPGFRGPEYNEPYINNAGLVHKEVFPEILEGIKTMSDDEFKKMSIDYSRREWKHWASGEDRACWNVRNQVLVRDAVPNSVKFVDKFKKPSGLESACAIGVSIEEKGKIKIDTSEAGEWICPYSGVKITDPSKIDIDHVIPLSYAAKTGGQEWSAEKKTAFANDLDNLLATSAKENRSKGDKGPSKYMPPLKAYRCNYAKTFTTLVYKYDLTIPEADYEALSKEINACKH